MKWIGFEQKVSFEELTRKSRQAEATLLSDGQDFVLLLTMATVGHSQPLSAYKQPIEQETLKEGVTYHHNI